MRKIILDFNIKIFYINYVSQVRIFYFDYNRAENSANKVNSLLG